MANIEDQLRNVRTLEDIVNILAILFNNMNSISRVYYDIFLNGTPMLVPVKLYDDNGVLVDREIPNVAYYRTGVIFCDGSPQEAIAADAGKFCIDRSNNDLYYKASGTDSTGWKKVYSTNSDTFLTPTGNGSGLTNLDMTHATAGPLSVLYGGTGYSADENFVGLVRANGTQPFSKAVPNTDYVSPASMVGVVSHYAGNTYKIGESGEKIVGDGWLVCDGTECRIENYRALYEIIGTKYSVDGKGDGRDTFCLPNLIGHYVKGSTIASGDTQSAVVGKHTHELGSATAGAAGEHKHGPGTYNITGGFQGAGQFADGYQGKNQTSSTSPLPYGAFKTSGKRYKVGNSGAEKDWYYQFNAKDTWSGETAESGVHTHSLTGTTSPNTSDDVENDVKHLDMIPIIKF